MHTERSTISPRVSALASLLILGSLLGPGTWAQGEAEDEDGPENGTPALHEEVTVSATHEGVVIGPRGASTSVVEIAESDGASSTLAEVVTELAGVAENGQGGLFQVVSIRGVSRQRVTSLISGMRLTSERRAGVSVSFLDPTLMGVVDVLRGPATTFYGPGALGGVMQVLPREFAGSEISAGYGSEGNERFQTFGTGGEGWSAAVAHRRAGDGETADGEIRFSRFEQVSAVLQRAWTRGDWGYEFLVIPSYARDVGKPNTDFTDRDRRTIYPRERHGLMRFAMRAPTGWHLQTWIHAQDLETDVLEEGVSHNRVTNDSLDFGARWETTRVARERYDLRYGVESFSRRGVDSLEREEDLAPVDPEDPVTLRTLDGGRMDEVGAFGSAGGSWGPTRWQAGTRLTWARQENAGQDARSLSAWSGFGDLAWPVSERLELRGGLSSGLRFPSLGELFFSGTTARGGVVGNPDLDSERSLNSEVSVRWLGRRVFASGVIFRNRIADYIERIEVEPGDPDLLTYENQTSGVIQGIEMQGILVVNERLRFVGAAHWIDGENADGDSLADIPAHEYRAGFRRDTGRWRLASSLGYRDDKSDPGSGEREIGSAWLLSASLGWSPAPAWRLALTGENLLDETYRPSADDKAIPAAGRTLGLNLTWRRP